MELRNWRGNEFKQMILQTMGTRLEVAAILLKNEMKQEVSEPSPPPADAGEPFHKDTGRARASFAHEVNKAKLTARVGSNMLVVKFQEFGTRFMPAHPVIGPTFRRNIEKISQILRGKK